MRKSVLFSLETLFFFLGNAKMNVIAFLKETSQKIIVIKKKTGNEMRYGWDKQSVKRP